MLLFFQQVSGTPSGKCLIYIALFLDILLETTSIFFDCNSQKTLKNALCVIKNEIIAC